MSDTDLELLARYTRNQAEDAFAELVRRHLDLVHSAALRQVRSPQLAEEVAQSAFIKLARQARWLAPDTLLAAWLYQVTRREAIDVVRRETRRQSREQLAAEMNAMNAAAADWTHIEPLLDEAMHTLDDLDRAAVLLRYFENKSLREVGQSLGTSENAAQKRVSRAVECLREFFAKRGVTVGASGLVGVLSANAVQAAPVGLAATISTAAVLAVTAVAATATGTATKTITMTTLQKTLGAATLALAVAAPLYLQHRSIKNLRVENARARELAASASREATPPSALTPTDAAEVERLRREHDELLRLRGEVSRLRQDLADLALKRPASVAPPAQDPEQPPEPVQIFVANADANVPAGQTLAFGGWATPAGKRTLVFVQPRIEEPSSAGRPRSILLESRFLEIPDEILDKVVSDLNLPGLDRLKANGKASSLHSLFTTEETALVLATLENTAGVVLLSAPRVHTAEGVQAVVSVTKNEIVAGQEHALGPSLDLEPRIAADGFSVNLTVFARLRKAGPTQ